MDAGLIDGERFDQYLKIAQERGLKIEEVLVSEKIISENDLKKLEASF